MDRAEGAAPRPCGPSTGFPASGRQIEHSPFLGRPLAPGSWPGGSLLSSCGLRSDQARRWRPGTVARHIGWSHVRHKARRPAPPRAIHPALTPRSRSELESHWAPAATPDRESSPGGTRCDLTARPTHCGSAGPTGPRLSRSRHAEAPSPPTLRRALGCPRQPGLSGSALPARRAALPEGGLPAKCAILGRPTRLSRNSRRADLGASVRR